MLRRDVAVWKGWREKSICRNLRGWIPETLRQNWREIKSDRSRSPGVFWTIEAVSHLKFRVSEVGINSISETVVQVSTRGWEGFILRNNIFLLYLFFCLQRGISVLLGPVSFWDSLCSLSNMDIC